MSNSVLPALPGLAWQNTKAPQFSTKIQTSVGMSEVRAAFNPYPVRRYMLVHNFLRSYSAFTEMATLYGFFCARQGSFDSFLYDDPEDDLIANTAPYMQFGTGDGATVAFQLGRSLGSFFEPVYNTHSTPKIYVNSVLQTTPANYSISASGLVTFTSPPGLGLAIAWSGSYYWRCRFDDDSLEFSEFASLFWEQKRLSFRTLLGA
jgi:uncharacterized protein (TIGR02217 family)